ncbi:uncharacterized protein LOC118200741 isoform X2 [Stegodyphus dumicola]|uniref:uncharacterized protein LOC118200741 isoform X2 n=1 Tax=Stegodyphus dumicola TaxID=202533 RepID=UPI0015B28A97|nr:uncharacterized protein LOC118200741 isoform X2 [Stegodyphus dumicola]
MNLIGFLGLLSVASLALADPFAFGFANVLPPYGIPVVSPELEKELGIEKSIGKEIAFEKSWPWLEKDFAFDKGVGVGIGIGKEFEFEKGFGLGVEKGIGIEKAFEFEKAFPWLLYEKYFGIGKKITFEQALAYELYKLYGWYGLWVAKELERRFMIAKELGLIGREIEFQEAISLGLFKGIGLDKVFESARKAIGAEKTFEIAKEFSFEKPPFNFGFKKF